MNTRPLKHLHALRSNYRYYYHLLILQSEIEEHLDSLDLHIWDVRESPELGRKYANPTSWWSVFRVLGERKSINEDETGEDETGEDETGEGETGEGETGEGETDEGETDKGGTDKGETDKGETDEGETDEGETDKMTKDGIEILIVDPEVIEPQIRLCEFVEMNLTPRLPDDTPLGPISVRVSTTEFVPLLDIAFELVAERIRRTLPDGCHGVPWGAGDSPKPESSEKRERIIKVLRARDSDPGDIDSIASLEEARRERLRATAGTQPVRSLPPQFLAQEMIVLIRAGRDGDDVDAKVPPAGDTVVEAGIGTEPEQAEPHELLARGKVVLNGGGRDGDDVDAKVPPAGDPTVEAEVGTEPEQAEPHELLARGKIVLNGGCRDVYDELTRGPLTCDQLLDRLASRGTSETTIKRHLKCLKGLGLVANKRDREGYFLTNRPPKPTSLDT